MLIVMFLVAFKVLSALNLVNYSQQPKKYIVVGVHTAEEFIR